MPAPKKLVFTSTTPDFVGSGDDFIEFDFENDADPSQGDDEDVTISSLFLDDDLEITDDDDAEAVLLTSTSQPSNATALPEPLIISLDEQLNEQFNSVDFIL